MYSRFTEIFNVQQQQLNWEICNSEPASPSPSALTNDESFFTTSTDTLNTLSDFNTIPDSTTSKCSNHPLFIQQTQSLPTVLSGDDSPNSTNPKKHIKSKLKLLIMGAVTRRNIKQ